jgi:hypothetical protein
MPSKKLDHHLWRHIVIAEYHVAGRVAADRLPFQPVAANSQVRADQDPAVSGGVGNPGFVEDLLRWFDAVAVVDLSRRPRRGV